MNRVLLISTLVALIFADDRLFAQPVAPTQPSAPGKPSPTRQAPAAGRSATAGPQIPDTLMFTIDEFNEIQSHLAGTTAEVSENNAIESATLYLSTILYAGPSDWTIWVNGVPIGPHDEFQSFKVTSVSPSAVELLVPMSAQGMRPVHLGPNQTFVARSGIVVEGRTQ